MMLVLLEVLEVDGVTTTITKEVAIILRKDLEEDHLTTITIIMEDIKSLKKEIDKEEVGDSIIIIIARMEVVGVVKGILIAHGKITILAVKLVEVDGKIITIMDLISGKEIAKKMILAEDGD